MLNARKRYRWHGPPTPAAAPDPRDANVDAADGEQAVATLSHELGVDPLVARLLIQRDLSDPERARAFLEPSIKQLNDPAIIPGIARAARRITDAINARQPIVIFGDYDVDGVTAASILWHMLKQLGADDTTIYIPHRIDEGYGLNTEAIEQLATRDDEQKPLIISVDCGITAVEPAAKAKALGLDLIITDHHHFDQDDLPDAHTLVHPGLPRDAASTDDSNVDLLDATDEQIESSRNLCGAGVAYKLAWQVARTYCGSERLPDPLRAMMVNLLSLVALGTVADVVPLVDENRVLTIFGLQRITQSPFPGVNALIDAAKLRNEKVSAYDVGFKLGPRLNACGRMGHAAKAAHLLTEAAMDEATEIATFLTKENDRRRKTEREIFNEAKQMVLDCEYHNEDCRAIVLGKTDWHPGVIGIVASRLVEAFHRPVVMLSIDNGSASGSARSVDGVSIHDAIQTCRDMLDRFGGHAMAAGLGLPTDRIDAFRDALVAEVNTKLPPEHLSPVVKIDAELTLGQCQLPLFDQILRLAPFGRGNPSPVLLTRNVTVGEARRVGKSGDHLSLFLRQDQAWQKAIAFGMGDLAEQLPAGSQIDVVFEPKVSTWQGQRRAEMHVVDLREAE